jgi:epoxide hydrolase-like predicted phosphatase
MLARFACWRNASLETAPEPMAGERAPAVRAVIFDVGGVLIQTVDRSALCRWEARLGLREGELAREIFSCPASWRASIGLATGADVWMELACVFRLHANEVRELAQDVFAAEAVDEAMAAFVASLRPRYKTALLSNAWPEARNSLHERRGLGEVADMLILSCEERLMKPDTRIYHLAAERLGVTPEEALFVDDCLVNVEGARDAGLRAYHYTTREAALHEMAALLP